MSGCASSSVTGYQPCEGRIERPDRVIVYHVAPTPAELAPEVAVAGEGAASLALTPAQLAAARRLGSEIGTNLVAELLEMALPAVRAAGEPAPRVGDGLVASYFTIVNEGSVTERVALGFGAGGAELKTVVKGFLVTHQGL